jgi:DNA-binding LytR/AlgR family response regulator
MKHIILSNTNILIRVQPKDIVYIESEGSYSNMFLFDGRRHIFSFNLSSFEKMLEAQLGTEAQTFIRVGKCLIINYTYIYDINLSRQELTLSGFKQDNIVLTASKDALKALKKMLEDSINKKMIGL